MASNNYLNANVTPSSDTFREWIDLTNRITYDMEKVVVSTVANTQGACTSGNAYVNGSFSANSLLVEDKLQGVSANSTVYGTKAAAANLVISSNVVFIANSTANAIIHAQSNAHFTGPKVEVSSNTFINSTSSLFQSNATLNDFNSNMDIDNALTDITTTDFQLSGTGATIDSTTLTVSGETANVNSNVDINNALTDITASNLAITGLETNIDANTVFTANVNIHSDSLDFNIGADEVIVNSSASLFQSNATLNKFNTTVDINGALDVDNSLTTINSANTLVENGELNITSNVNIDAATIDINAGVLKANSTAVEMDATAVTFTSNATTNIFNTPLDINGNMDVDNTLTDFTSTDFNVSGTNTLIDSTNMNIHGTNLDINSATNIDGDLTINANTIIGSAAADAVNVTAQVVSSIEPSANGKVLGHASRRWAVAATTANTSGDITAGADVDITGEVNAASAVIVGNGTVGGNLSVNAQLTVANSSVDTIVTSLAGNTRTITLGNDKAANATHAFDRLIVKGVVGNSTVGLLPLHGNNVVLGDTNHRWHNASFTNANTSGTLTSTGVITASANIEAAATTNTNVLKVTTTSTMGGKLTISSDGAAITGPVDLVNTINVGANVGMTTAHLLVKGTATVGNLIANSSVLHVGNTGTNTHISKAGIDTDGTLVVQKPTTLSNTVAAGNTTITGFAAISGNMKAASANVSGHSNVATLGATGAVDLDSTLTVEGLTNLKGSVDLGDAASDTVSFVADVDTNILPSANGKALGADTARWAAAFTDANTSGDLTVGDDINLAATSNIIFSNTGLSTSALTISGNNISVPYLQVQDGVTLPADTTITASTLSSANGTITNNFKITGATAGAANSIFTIGEGANTVSIEFANAQANGHLLAKSTNTSDIGSAAKSFRSGYFDTSLTVGTTVANTTALLADFVYAKQDLIANYSSDQQLKDNVLKIDTALDKVNSLGGYSFTWNNNIGDMRAGTPDYGVIAQEIENVLPHAVDINSRGHKTVNYNSLIPLLIEAVKELTERVKELEPDIEEPEEEIDG